MYDHSTTFFWKSHILPKILVFGQYSGSHLENHDFGLQNENFLIFRCKNESKPSNFEIYGVSINYSLSAFRNLKKDWNLKKIRAIFPKYDPQNALFSGILKLMAWKTLKYAFLSILTWKTPPNYKVKCRRKRYLNFLYDNSTTFFWKSYILPKILVFGQF